MKFKLNLKLALVIAMFSMISFGQDKPFEDKLGGMKIVEKARLTHGGEKLDAIKTLKIVGKTENSDGSLKYTIKIFMDFKRNLTRYEEWEKGKLKTASQFEKKLGKYSGWYFFSPGIEIVKEEDVSKVRSWSAVFCNIFNLRNENLKNYQVVKSKTIFESNPSSSVTAVIKDQTPIMDIANWIINKDGQLVGDTFTVSGSKLRQVLCTKFERVSGILFPSECISGENLPEFSDFFQLTSVEVNPQINAKEWKPPIPIK